jgi:AcrR family transcriptional regulator
MRRGGTTSRARVADIVAAAGLSNEAFYRHFASKDALVAALLDDGTERLRGYLAHQMAKERSPEGQVRRWVEGVLSQAHDEVAATTLAVLYNSGGTTEGQASGRHYSSGPLAALLHEPFAALGAGDPELAASFVAHAVLGTLSDHLWERTKPTPATTRRITDLCLAAAGAATTGSRR